MKVVLYIDAADSADAQRKLVELNAATSTPVIPVGVCPDSVADKVKALVRGLITLPAAA